MEKSYKSHDYLSRYSNIPYYYNDKDNKYYYGEKSNLNTDTAYTIHKVKRGETLDSIALDYYNLPTLYWIIADFNRIHDCYVELKEGQELKIPSIGSIYFE